MTFSAESDLLRMFEKRAPNPAERENLLLESASDLALPYGEVTSPVCIAFALLKMNTPVEAISRGLSWKEFEHLCAGLIRASGFEVRENVQLKKPRAQIDLVAFGTSVILTVDCKHWSRGHSPSSLKKFAEDQLRRSALLRRSIEDSRPIASVILSVSASEGKFVEGVPIVPIRTLGSFVSTFDAYSEMVSFR